MSFLLVVLLIYLFFFLVATLILLMLVPKSAPVTTDAELAGLREAGENPVEKSEKVEPEKSRPIHLAVLPSYSKG